MALIWKTWAPLKVKIFLWLAFRRRHWTGDRRRRHGLETREHCYLCDQAPETIDHVHSGHMPIYQGSMEPNLPSLQSSTPARFSNNHRLVAVTALWRLDRHPVLRHGLAVRAGFLRGLEAKERAVLQGCYVATDWAHLDHPGRGRQMDAGGCSRNGEPESAAARLVQTIKSCGCFIFFKNVIFSAKPDRLRPLVL